MSIADTRGLAGLTMRAVSQKLGAEAMSLYRHVRDKDDLLDGIVDLVYGEIALPRAGSEWRNALRRYALSSRDALRRHPWAIALMEARARPGPENLRHHDAVLGVLRAAHFTPLTATRAYNLVDSYVYGFALQEASLPFSTPEELAQLAAVMLRELPGDAYPYLRETATELAASRFDYAHEFEGGLDLILEGLERTSRGRA